MHVVTPESLHASSLLLLRLVEALPDEIALFVRDVELKLCLRSSSSTNSAPSDDSDVVCALSKVSLQAFDPRNRLLGRRAHASDGSLGEERKVSFELGALRLGLEAPLRELAPLLKLDALKVDLEAKLAASPVLPLAADDARETPAMLLCSARLSGETRGLSIAVGSELEPWVLQVHTTLAEHERREDSSASADSLSIDLKEPHPLWSCAAIELEIQAKVLQTEVLLQSLANPCAVLPSGVPCLLLTAEEINVFAHPFVGDQTLGVRSKADVQCSRLKILSYSRDQSVKTCFISLDFTRVFIEPTSLMNANQSPADVEMEAEWLEVKWTPQAMHAIGGMLELGIFIGSVFLSEPPGDAIEWDVDAKTHVQPLKTIDDVCADKLASSEAVTFRCTVKRALVLFAYSLDERRHVDYVTVESLTMSVEETTGRFRISVSQTKVYYVEPDAERSATSPTFANQRPPRRTTSTFASMRAGARAAAGSISKRSRRPLGFQSADDADGPKTAALPYFTVQTFALEETRLPHCPKTVVDIFVDSVHGDWDIATQLRVMELVRQITFATWEMLYAIRRGYAVHCTSPVSRYNRLGGINPPMDDAAERDRCASLLARLVSATGDTLNRLYATNVTLSARIASDTHLKLHLGVFSGDDLPELWTFRAISLQLNALELLAIDTVHVRHTVERRRDYVFGEFEAMLGLRLAACRSDTSHHARCDGMVIDIDGIRVCVSTQVPLLHHMARVRASVAPFLPVIETTMSKYWRPQHDVFFQYFLRAPEVPGRPQVWLSLASLTFECLDTPLESWLERMYPLWLDELQEQELRAQVLDDQVLTLKLTNADALCDGALDEMEALLVEKNAKIYVQKARKLRATYAQSRDSDAAATDVLVRLQIGRVAADVAFESDEGETLRRMRALDEASEAVASIFARSNREFTRYAPVLDVLEGMKLSVAVEDVAVQVRSFVTPLFLCSQISIAGDAIVAASAGPADRSINEDDRTPAALSLAAGLRTFVDLSVGVVGPIAFFSPSYAYTLDEIAGWMQRLLPLLLFDIDKELGTPLWDIARRLVHGNVHVLVQDAAVRLLCSPTSFAASDYLEVALGRLELAYAFEKTTVTLHRLAAKIDPGSLSNIVEFSNVTVEIWTKWTSGDGSSAVHFGFPLEYRAVDSDRSVTDRVYLDAWASRVLTLEQWSASHLTLSDRHPLKHYEAAGLSVFVRGTVCPWSANATGADVSTIKRTKHEVATRTAVVLYTKHIEWLIRFASLYSTLPRYPFPRRRQPQRQQRSVVVSLAPQASLLQIFKALVVEEFTVVGLDVAVYHSEKNPIGIRAFVNDHVAIAGSILAATHELFQSGPPTKKASKPRRLTVPFNDQTWVVHDATVAVQDIQVRVCTHSSGSRGESLVSVKHMTLKVGGGSEVAPTHDDSSKRSTAPLLETAPEARVESASGSKSTADARVRTKKNILEYFAIAQHNPYCFRDSDIDPRDDASASTPAEIEKSDERRYQASFVEEFRRLGFLMGLSAREARILVTISAIEALVDIVENWIRIATVCVPELFGNSDDGHGTADEKLASPTSAQDDKGPKKITSLAEDPKFGAIFYESVVRDEANSFVTRLAPPSFLASEPATASSSLSSSCDRAASGDTEPVASGSAPQTGANIVESFFMVKFMDCQVSVQDRIHKASMLLALNCGALKDSISSDACHELIDLKVDGLQLFTAPLDIDVKSRIVWLKTLPDGSYCPSSYGLLQQVIAPIPTKVVIWVDRNVTVVNKVDLQIPTIQVRLTVASKDILQHLATALTDVITAKICTTNALDYSKSLQSAVVATSCHAGGPTTSLASLRALKRELRWKIAELQWRQLCRWSYYVSERANVAFAAAESSRTLAFDVETSPLFRRRNASSASMSSSLSTTMSMSGGGAAHGDVDQHSDELQRLTQQLAAVSDALQSMVQAEQKRTQPLPNVELEFHLQTASLTLSGAHMDIVRASLSSLRFKMKQFEDQSGACTLTLQDLSTQNLCPGTPYPDLLQASATSNTWGGGNAFLRVDAEIAAPVGGITVVKHFEVNVHPLQVCITQEVILHLVAFFSSSDATDSSQAAHARDEVRSTFLQARPAASASDRLVGSALKKAAKVAGKAAHPLGRSKAAPRDDSDGGSGASSGTAPSTAARRSRSFTAVQDDTPAWALNAAAAAASRQANETQLLLQSDADFARPSGSDATPSDATEREANDMRDCAKPTILFKRMRIGTVEVVVTYKHKKSSSTSQQQQQQPLEDMRGFAVKVHALVYCDKTCSMSDLLLRIRRDVILDVLSQVGRNFTNIATFLRDQVDLTRWGQFDALAPLKTLSTTVTSLASAATSPLSSVAPAPVAGLPSKSPGEPSPRLRAATAPAPAPATVSPVSQDTGSAHKFQLELPETHRALRKKPTAANVRAAEVVSKVVGGNSSAAASSPAPSPCREGPGDDSDSDQQQHKELRPHRSTAGKAKHAIAHLFSKKRSGSAAMPLSPTKATTESTSDKQLSGPSVASEVATGAATTSKPPQ